MNTIIAVPSDLPGGLDASVNAHFGHCILYTLVEIRENQIKDIRLLPNVPHESGRCMNPVNLLASNNVTSFISGGMGSRPLTGFNKIGIDVYLGSNASTVGKAVDDFIHGNLPRFSQEDTCGKGVDHGDGHCGNHP